MKDTMRTWKDCNGQSLPIEGQSTLCANPTSRIELTDAELETICGGDGDLLGGATLGGLLGGLKVANLPVGGLLDPVVSKLGI